MQNSNNNIFISLIKYSITNIKLYPTYKKSISKIKSMFLNKQTEILLTSK